VTSDNASIAPLTLAFGVVTCRLLLSGCRGFAACFAADGRAVKGGDDSPAQHGFDPLHAMQFRAAPSSQVREPPPSLTASPSDRDYPLDTTGARCLWHAGGTTARTTTLAPGGDGSGSTAGCGPPAVTTASWASREGGAAAGGDLVVVRHRTPVCRAAKTARELLDQCP
jgi:hypothetical protein